MTVFLLCNCTCVFTWCFGCLALFFDGIHFESSKLEIIFLISFQFPKDIYQIIGPIITKVRKIVKMFKRSPTKNENYLQKYVKIELEKVIHLIMD